MSENQEMANVVLEDEEFRARLESLEKACKMLSGQTEYLADKVDLLNTKMYDKYEKDTAEGIKQIFLPSRCKISKMEQLSQTMAEQRKSMEILQTEMDDKTLMFANNLQEVDTLHKQLQDDQERIQTLDKILHKKLETVNYKK